MQYCESLQEENAKMRHALLSKEESHSQLEASMGELSNKYNNLKLAQGISMSEEERRNAKLRYTKLVREIDKCIALLNE